MLGGSGVPFGYKDRYPALPPAAPTSMATACTPAFGTPPDPVTSSVMVAFAPMPPGPDRAAPTSGW